ncbi:hypothetical protein ES705_27918 [subsurface metagenome]
MFWILTGWFTFATDQNLSDNINPAHNSPVHYIAREWSRSTVARITVEFSLVPIIMVSIKISIICAVRVIVTIIYKTGSTPSHTTCHVNTKINIRLDRGHNKRWRTAICFHGLGKTCDHNDY